MGEVSEGWDHCGYNCVLCVVALGPCERVLDTKILQQKLKNIGKTLQSNSPLIDMSCNSEGLNNSPSPTYTFTPLARFCNNDGDNGCKVVKKQDLA